MCDVTCDIGGARRFMPAPRPAFAERRHLPEKCGLPNLRRKPAGEARAGGSVDAFAQEGRSGRGHVRTCMSPGLQDFPAAPHQGARRAEMVAVAREQATALAPQLGASDREFELTFGLGVTKRRAESLAGVWACRCPSTSTMSLNTKSGAIAFALHGARSCCSSPSPFALRQWADVSGRWMNGAPATPVSSSSRSTESGIKQPPSELRRFRG
jgi:hypothetical protein